MAPRGEFGEGAREVEEAGFAALGGFERDDRSFRDDGADESGEPTTGTDLEEGFDPVGDHAFDRADEVHRGGELAGELGSGRVGAGCGRAV